MAKPDATTHTQTLTSGEARCNHAHIDLDQDRDLGHGLYPRFDLDPKFDLDLKFDLDPEFDLDPD